MMKRGRKESKEEGTQMKGENDPSHSSSFNQFHMHNQSEIAQPCRDREAEKGGRR
jgi:hypothetical protein